MKIAFVLNENMLAIGLTYPFEAFFAANQLAKIADFQSEVEEAELICIADTDQSHIVTLSGLELSVDKSLASSIKAQEQYDLVYLPSLWRNPRPTVKKSTKLIAWLRWQFEHGAILNSVGTGVCFIAETGLLDHKAATTHWYYFEQFSKDYPLVELKRQHFITASGNIYCAASINSLMDLTIYHIHRFFGKAVSQHIERHFSHEIRQDFDKISYFQEENTNHPDETILQIQLWMQNNLSKSPVLISELANQFGLTTRSLDRRFKKSTNMTPIQYLQNRRIITAKELLQNSNLSIGEIAFRVGYVDSSYFSKLFKKHTSITPKQYRTTVRATLYDSKRP